ncbi:YfgM family protein [Aquifex sp.]
MRDLYLFLGIVALLVLGVWGYNFYEFRKEEKLKEIAYKVYLYEKGKISYEEALKYAKDTPLYPYLQALKGNYEDVEKSIKDEELKSLYAERVGAELYQKGKLAEAKKKAESVDKERFNYPSALSLRAFIYEKEGEKDKALGIWATLKKEFSDTYFGRLAELKLEEVKK